MTLRKIWPFLAFCFVTMTLGISGCDDEETGDCPEISGTWEITAHCSPSVVGSTMVFSQSGCIINQIDPWTDWSGSIDEEGNMIWSGPADGGETMVCNATLDGDTISATCSPTCDVTTIRQ